MSDTLQQIAILALPILTAVTFHELAHGLVADRLGDPTARAAGRLTANPLAHLDPVGTLVFVLTRMIGWAKPVPVNPNHFADPRKGMLLVALAGPGANFVLALAFGLVYRLLVLFPVALDSELGGRVVLPLLLISQAGVLINLGLGLFNLVPIPPLDGSKVLAGLLSGPAAAAYSRLDRYGFLLLLLLVFSGVLDKTLFPLLRSTASLLLG